MSLVDPTTLVSSGEIDSSTFGDRLALTGNVIIGTSFDATHGGVQTATLDKNNPYTGPCRECAAQVSKPVNVTNGNVWVEQGDYAQPGLGGGLALSRIWNSLWSKTTTPKIAGVFGDSWQSTYEEQLQFKKDGSIEYWLGDGEHWSFVSSDSGLTYKVTVPANENATISLDAKSKNYQLSFQDGSQHLFNSTGLLLSLIDRNANAVNVSYDSALRLSKVTDASGHALNFNYPDASTRQAQSISDAVGVVASYTYNGMFLSGVTYADGSGVRFTYNGRYIATVTDNNGKVLEAHTYDDGGRGLVSSSADGVQKVSIVYNSNGSTQVTNSLGVTTTFNHAQIGGVRLLNSISGPGCGSCSVTGDTVYSHDSRGNKTAVTDESGATSRSIYDDAGNMVSSTIMNGATPLTSSYTYNVFGDVLTATDPLGNVSSNTYDAHGNLLTVTAPAPKAGAAASVTQFAYNSRGQLTTITDPLGHVTTIAYDADGMAQSIKDAKGNVTSYKYDARGNRISSTDALNNVTSFKYDAMNRVVEVDLPGASGGAVKYGYDSRGRRISVTDQNGKQTLYAYNDADELISTTDAMQQQTLYAYDSEGNLSSITDAKGHATSFQYDEKSRVIKTVFPSQLFESYSYDAVGNLISKSDRKKQTITYAYDALYRLTSKSTGQSYSYDNDGRLLEVTDATGKYDFAYDGMGRLTGTTTAYAFLPNQSLSNAYAYDVASNRVSYTAPDGSTTQYAYDELSRLTLLTNSWAGAFAYSYDALSRRTQLARPNAVNTSYNFDTLSRLQSVLHGPQPSSPVDGASYSYDAAGNRTAKQNLLTGVNEGYAYDDIYQLTQVTRGGTIGESFGYDAVGNRISSSDASSLLYNISNELTASDSTTFAYDDNGDMTSRTQGASTVSYQWSAENQLMQATNADGSVVSFKYDPFGRRIYKSSAMGATIYAYDGANAVAEYDTQGSLTASYAQGMGVDEPLAMRRGGSTYYYHADGLGSITSLTDASGAIAQSYTYTSFGKTTSTTALVSPYQYTGREYDAETGLYYYRARYYDSAIGRFVSEDQQMFFQGGNFYSYVNNRSIGYIDPTGSVPVKPANLPVGTKEKYWNPFEEGFAEALNRLNSKNCADMFNCPSHKGTGNDGAEQMRKTEYRFGQLPQGARAGAQTVDSTHVQLNTIGLYMTAQSGEVRLPDGTTIDLGNATNVKAFILLHELGHQLSEATGFTEDTDAATNSKHSLRVIKACFK